MPRLDGYELARRIRDRERETGAGRTPIIALSANVMTGEPSAAEGYGRLRRQADDDPRTRRPASALAPLP